MTNPIKGAQYFLRGLGLLNQSGIRRYVIIPFLLNISIFTVLMYVAAGYFNDFLDWSISFLPEALNWLIWILWPLFFIICLLVFSFSFSIIANLIAAPFNSFLAFAIETKLTGTPPPNSGLGLWAEIALSLKNALRNLAYAIMWAIPVIIVSFIPVINILTPFLWLIYGSWMMSLQYLDYPMGNYSMSFKNIRANLAEKRILTLGFGGITTAATMIPIVNFLVMPTAVAGATILWVEEYLPQQETYEDKELTNETLKNNS